MCRLMAFASLTETTLPSFVGKEFPEFVELSKAHRDGWGLALASREGARVTKTSQSAAESPSFTDTVFSQTSSAGLLHFRWASPGLEVTDKNSHPFHYGDIAMIHNGAVTPYESLISRIDSELLTLRNGDTDSELYFLFVLTMIHRSNFLDGVRAAIRTIKSEFDYSSINSMFFNNDYLVVVSEHNLNRIPAEGKEDYYELRYRLTDEGIVAASSGWKQDGWKLLENHQLLIYDRKNKSHTLESI